MDEANRAEMEAAAMPSVSETALRVDGFDLAGGGFAKVVAIDTSTLAGSDERDPVQASYPEGWTMLPPVIPPPYQVVMIGINGGVTERTFEDKSLMLAFVAALEGSPVRVRVYRGHRCNFTRSRSLQFQDGENSDVMAAGTDEYDELDCEKGV